MDRAQIAASYNDLMGKGYFSDGIGGNELYIGSLMTAQIPQQAESILEIGGATGLWMNHVLRERKSIRDVTVVEISDAIQRYRSRIEPILKTIPNSRFEAIHGDFLEVKDQLRPAHIVASSYVAEYMGDTTAYIQKLYDLTKPGGKTIFLDVLSNSYSCENGINFTLFIKSFWRTSIAHIQNRKFPPFSNSFQVHTLSKLFKESAFQKLNSHYHSKYYFPKQAWLAEQKKYPKAKFYDLGITGILVLSKD